MTAQAKPKPGELTVRELIALLEKVDPDAVVLLEGCDCSDGCGHVDEEDGFAFLRRRDRPTTFGRVGSST